MNAIDADQRNIRGNLKSQLVEPRQQAEGHHVVHRDHRSRQRVRIRDLIGSPAAELG